MYIFVRTPQNVRHLKGNINQAYAATLLFKAAFFALILMKYWQTLIGGLEFLKTCTHLYMYTHFVVKN